MRKANIHVLLVEDLTDLLYELSDVYSLQNEVECKYPDHFRHRITKAIFYAAHLAEIASMFTDNIRDAQWTIDATIMIRAADGYVDRSDLTYSVKKATDHVVRMNMAYQNELDSDCKTLLRILQIVLTDTSYLIYGDRENLRLPEESAPVQE